MLMVRHRGPLNAELHQRHGVRLATLRRSGLTVRDLADFAAALPPDSAVARAVNPDWFITPDTLLLREIEHGQRVLMWQKTEDGHSRHPKHFPKPLPVTQSEIEAQKTTEHEFDVMTIDEADEFLGWNQTEVTDGC